MWQGFSEHGGGAFNLDYASTNSNALSSVLGLRFLKGLGTLFGHPLDWQTELAWEHRFSGTAQWVSAAFTDEATAGAQWKW
ncbi:autotransporter domain-containing protein [Burkholderia sp. WSM2232]|uniref:autotransporter domain-containing protein n=1 Tax=Burkholderia sp. WSM2232 TaxID=944436 RepID=UPI0003F9C598|nr:autotransporter outer membrane beta-barrel domain-containing protein [Burkholderia sp. WSM2232]